VVGFAAVLDFVVASYAMPDRPLQRELGNALGSIVGFIRLVSRVWVEIRLQE
jgi:hypothetical protein